MVPGGDPASARPGVTTTPTFLVVSSFTVALDL
jgi:hypothetical protein